MKVKKKFINDDLSEFGFTFNPVTDDDDFETEWRYVHEIGHSRRGQHYYLTIHPDTREIRVFATKPDGRGTDIEIGDALLDMFEKGVIECS